MAEGDAMASALGQMLILSRSTSGAMDVDVRR